MLQYCHLKVFLFANSKCKRYFHNRLKPSKLCWTAVYRKQHKKVFLYSLLISVLNCESMLYLLLIKYEYELGYYIKFRLLSVHLQDISAEAVKKRRRTTKKPYSRSIVGATLEVIQKKRSEKPEVRDAAREAALRLVLLQYESY